MPGVAGPLRPGERTADLAVTIDSDTVCLTAGELDAAIAKRRPAMDAVRSDSDDELVYTVRGDGNLISLTADAANGHV